MEMGSIMPSTTVCTFQSKLLCAVSLIYVQRGLLDFSEIRDAHQKHKTDMVHEKRDDKVSAISPTFIVPWLTVRCYCLALIFDTTSYDIRSFTLIFEHG